ncbi:MAG: pleiotropic regulatory protein [Nitrospiraceae bacterium]|nr:MAG: pleiotropic regulatory protein [Nitrospiraceae bacterium]
MLKKSSMSVPFFRYGYLYARYKEEIDRILADVMSRGAFILQKDLAEFENDLAQYVGAKHAIGVSDGTNAMLLGFWALGLPKGSEVIMCSHTYVATAAAAYFAGLKPVPVDMDDDRMISTAAVEAAITERTSAVMPTQLNGRTAKMDALMSICQKHELVLVEDAAQGLGSRYRNKMAGTFGAFGTYSFYPAKTLGCFGDGGALVTNDDDIAMKVKRLRDHGRDEDGRFVCWGTNSRLDNLQAAILKFKLSRFDDDVVKYRRAIAARYCQNLNDVADIGLPPSPNEDADHFDVYQNFEIEAESRDQLREFLKERGIGTLIQWNGQPLHRLKSLGLERPLPRTERFFQRCLMLPIYPGLSMDEVDYVCEMIRQFYGYN